MRIFSRYVLVAAMVGLVTLASREILAFLLPDFFGEYAVTMILAYCLGIFLNYFQQGRYTFADANHRFNLCSALRFGTIAVLASILVVFAAYLLRYALGMDRWLYGLAPAAAFGGAALLGSPLSFYLQRRQVFLASAIASGEKEPTWVWPSLVGLLVVMFFLYSGFPVGYNTAAKYDSGLFLHLAMNLAKGEWLGAYNNLTLAKGAGFPLWLAGVHLLGIPVSSAAVLFYAFSCLTAFFSLKPLLPSSSWRLVIFAALLFCPGVFSSFLLLRELIYPSLTLLVIAACLGFSVRMRDAGEGLAPWLWGAGLGASSALFWITREEAIWLAPLLLLPLMSVLKTWFGSPLSRRHVIAVSLFAMAFFFLPLLALCGINYKNYGLFVDVEINRRPFASAYGALARIRKPSPPPLVPVSKAMRREAYRVSPAFSELEPVLEGMWTGTLSVSVIGEMIDKNPNFRREMELLLGIEIAPGLKAEKTLRSAYASNPQVTRCFHTLFGGERNAEVVMSDRLKDEIAGGWFLWALRDAVAAAGYHQDGPTAAAYYRRLAEEMNEACSRGKLTCYPERHTLSPVLRRKHLVPFVGTFWRALISIPDMLVVMPLYSTVRGPVEQRRLAEAFLHNSGASRSSPLQEGILLSIAVFYRIIIPVFAIVALFFWIVKVRYLKRKTNSANNDLWLICAILFSLCFGRLSLLSFITVTSWPAVVMRYIVPGFPPLLLFIGLGLYLGFSGMRIKKSGAIHVD